MVLDRCCAQFLVHRRAVWRRPRSFYAAALAQLQAHVDDDDAAAAAEAKQHAAAIARWEGRRRRRRQKQEQGHFQAQGRIQEEEEEEEEEPRPVAPPVGSSRKWGLLFEWLWHVIFDQPPLPTGGRGGGEGGGGGGGDGAGLVRLADEVLLAATRAVDLEAADRVVLDRSACVQTMRRDWSLRRSAAPEGAGK